MLRGLVIRQAFVLLDLALAILVVVIAFMVIQKMTGAQVQATVPEGPSEASPDDLVVAKVGPLDQYLGIASSGMFGKSATIPKETDKTDQPPTGPVVETTLPLKLRGAIATSPTDPLANAVIENTKDKSIDTYYIGQPVMQDVMLVEVYGRRVVLDNKPKKAREFLEMEEAAAEAAGPAAGRPAPTPMAPGARPTGVVIKRDEVAQELSTSNVANLITTVAPETLRDENGNVTGITSPNISKIPLAQKMGLQDNDVLQTVNGVQIDSEDKIPEIIEKFGNLNVFRLGILRDGKPQVITFRME